MTNVLTFPGPARTQYIGGSDIGALLGVNPYKTPLQLYREKVGLDEPAADNPHTKRGIALESVAAEWYAKETSIKLRRSNKFLRHLQHEFIGGHMDRELVGRDAMAEIKCPSLGAWSKLKREGLRPDYVAQMQWYLGLSGKEFGVWIIFCADQWDGLHWTLSADYPMFEKMVEKATEFWYNHVIPRVPPSPTDDDTERLTIEAQGGTAVRRDDPEFVEAMRLLREAKTLSKEAAQIEETAKERILALVNEEPNCYTGPGYRAYLRLNEGRTTFDKKALAANRPLDRTSVWAELIPALHRLAPLALPEQIEEVVATVGKCHLDLAKFEKQGKPFTSLRPYFTGGD